MFLTLGKLAKHMVQVQSSNKTISFYDSFDNYTENINNGSSVGLNVPYVT